MALTPTQVAELTRRRYNGVNDDFWSDDEVIKLLFEGEMELAIKAHVIQDKDTSITTVASTQSYAYPSNTIAIRRIEYDGEKLKQISFREDDALTLSNSTSTVEGTPQYYYLWDDTIYLRVIPDAAKTLTVYRFKEPTILTTSSTAFSIPSRYQLDLIDYAVGEMAAKDKNFKVARYFNDQWDKKVFHAKMYEKKRNRSSGYATVKDEEALAVTALGSV